MISFNFFVFSFFTHNVPLVISLIVLFTHLKKLLKYTLKYTLIILIHLINDFWEIHNKNHTMKLNECPFTKTSALYLHYISQADSCFSKDSSFLPITAHLALLWPTAFKMSKLKVPYLCCHSAVLSVLHIFHSPPPPIHHLVTDALQSNPLIRSPIKSSASFPITSNRVCKKTFPSNWKCQITITVSWLSPSCHSLGINSAPSMINFYCISNIIFCTGH